MKSNNPKFSIITVCYNCKEDLEKTIKSVRDQSSNNYEYIVIDGNSTDGTVDILNKYNKDIAYWVSEPDKGIYNAMNKGAKVAKGEYLYFLNAGDIFADKDVLKKVEDEIEDKDMVYGKIRVVNKRDQDSYIRDKTLTKSNIKLGTKVSQQAVFVRKDVLDKVGWLKEKYKIASDFNLLCTIIDDGYAYKKIDLIVCNYDGEGISSNLKRSYSDTSKVIKNRYGWIYYLIYLIHSRVKLIVASLLNK